MKIRFIEPGNRPYRLSPLNYFVYERTVRTPSNGILTLATILKREFDDVFCYSESISHIRWKDVLDADVVFLSIFTFNAPRGYALADYIRANSGAKIVFGGLHATLNGEEALAHGDYVLRGEGDESILPFTRALAAGRRPADVPGALWREGETLVDAGAPVPPRDIDTVPDRTLLYRFKKMAGHNTLWPQVHASRGCPHCCDYCALVAAFGRTVRTRTPESVVEDIRQAIDFFDRGHHRLAKMLWITDDNFFADRAWAVSVLNAIIQSGIRYAFTVQARYEVGFDDEMLDLLKQAGFQELALGIEFLEDAAFAGYHKKSTYREICDAVANIQRHGLRTRGLFIFGADTHTPGIGAQLAEFVEEHRISGILIQSMYFIPGTPVYESHKDRLLRQDDWARCVGKVVHWPEHMTPSQLQGEIIAASRRVYSRKNLLRALVCKRGLERILFLGEYFWQASVRADLKKDRKLLRELEAQRLPQSVS